MSNELVQWSDSVSLALNEGATFFCPPGAAHPIAFVQIQLKPNVDPATMTELPFRIAIKVKHKEEIESPAPEPDKEEPLDPPGWPTPPCDDGVGSAGPLPDALLQEGEVVEGVGCEPEADLGEREVAFFDACRCAVDDLHFAYCAARAASCSTGSLTAGNVSDLSAELSWGADDLRLYISMSASIPERQDDRPT